MVIKKAIRKVVEGFEYGREFTAGELYDKVIRTINDEAIKAYPPMDGLVTRKFRTIRDELDCVYIGHNKYKKVMGLIKANNGMIHCAQGGYLSKLNCTKCFLCDSHGKNYISCLIKGE